MTKILFLISQKNFRDEELREPKAIFEAAGFSTCVASETISIATGSYGLQVKPDVGYSEAFRRIDEFNAIVVVGGYGCMAMMHNSYVVRILQQAKEKSKIVAAICWGPRILAKAGILNGRHITASYGSKDSDVAKELTAAGAVLSEDSVVVDGRVITANGPAAAKEFGEAILKKLQE